jgi:outer membrane murein-binding lipoprotein Lpp
MKKILISCAVLISLLLSGCSSESSKVSKACGLVESGSAGLKAGLDSYTDDYTEAANILKDLAAKDSKYSDPYKAALLWASGDNLNISDLELLISLEELCTPDEEESQ